MRHRCFTQILCNITLDVEPSSEIGMHSEIHDYYSLAQAILLATWVSVRPLTLVRMVRLVTQYIQTRFRLTGWFLHHEGPQKALCALGSRHYDHRSGLWYFAVSCARYNWLKFC